MNKALVPSHLLVPAGTGSLDAYIQEVNKIPMLSLEEEQDLANLYRDHDDLEAARRLVLAHLRFVVHVAKGYSGACYFDKSRKGFRSQSGRHL